MYLCANYIRLIKIHLSIRTIQNTPRSLFPYSLVSCAVDKTVRYDNLDTHWDLIINRVGEKVLEELNFKPQESLSFVRINGYKDQLYPGVSIHKKSDSLWNFSSRPFGCSTCVAAFFDIVSIKTNWNNQSASN